MLDTTQIKNIKGQLYTFKSNEPFLLDDPHTVWLLQSGSIAVFTVTVKDGNPEGSRHYLFNSAPGEALFGSALSSEGAKHRGILAIAVEATQLLQVSLEHLLELVVAGDREAIDLLENWVRQLGTGLNFGSASGVSVPAAGNRYLALTNGQILQPVTGKVSWVKLQQGSARWMGLETLMLRPESGVSPLSTAMWLEADGTVEVAVAETTDISDVDTLAAGLSQLHANFCRCLNWVEQQQAETEFLRFQERQQRDRQVSEAALGEMAAVMQPIPAEFFQEGTLLLVAVGAVGRALGITISPPARSEDLQRVKDPLDAIARASGFRTRKTILAGRWWQQNNGPLLAYTEREQQPIALLLKSNRSYELFDPLERTRIPVDAGVAATVAPEAYMFYRPLPAKIGSALAIFKFGVKGYAKDLLFVIITGVVATLLGMVTPQATSILIDNAIPDSDRGLVMQIGLALFAVAIGRSAFELAQGVLTLRVENAADAALQPAVWDKLLSLKPSFFRQYSSGDIQSRVMGVSQIRQQLSGAVLRTLLSGVFAVLNLGLMFAYSWKLTLIAIVIALFAIFVTGFSSFAIVRKKRPLQELDGVLLGLSVQLINGVAKLRVAAAEERAFAYWSKRYTQQKKLTVGSQRIDDSVSVFNEALPTVSSILFFWFAILFIQQAQGGSGGFSAGTFLAFNSAFGTFIGGATELSNTLTDVLEIVPMWERVQTIIKATPEVEPSMADPGRLTGRLTLEHVTFRYREDGPLTLDDVSIHAAPGEFIAVVGPSGSGKSTIFRLLLGFDTPASGTVYYDGQDLAGLDIHAVRRQLGVVLQNGRINTGSLFDLITGGALVTMDEAWEAARNAGFAEDVEQMPMGMHTMVSEGGTNLSGGQRQRLLIARALVLKPKIILMDEATSALDNRTQAIVSESLDKMNATRVVIAHRLSTIRNANRIYVVEAGRVVQVGTFEELVSQEGMFARLVARQLE